MKTEQTTITEASCQSEKGFFTKRTSPLILAFCAGIFLMMALYYLASDRILRIPLVITNGAAALFMVIGAVRGQRKL
jgi:hypothetical protein